MDTHLDGGDQMSATSGPATTTCDRSPLCGTTSSDEACKLSVLALVMSRMDYCNGLLAAATQLQMDKLQRIQNRAARLVVRPRVARGQVLHITPILKQLHWLPVRHRVIYKLCLQVYKCMHGTGPAYLQELLHLYTRDQLLPCHPKRKVGRAGFRIAGPVAWNGLPSVLRGADSVATFKAHLKTHLWHSVYD